MMLDIMECLRFYPANGRNYLRPSGRCENEQNLNLNSHKVPLVTQYLFLVNMYWPEDSPVKAVHPSETAKTVKKEENMSKKSTKKVATAVRPTKSARISSKMSSDSKKIFNNKQEVTVKTSKEPDTRTIKEKSIKTAPKQAPTAKSTSGAKSEIKKSVSTPNKSNKKRKVVEEDVNSKQKKKKVETSSKAAVKGASKVAEKKKGSNQTLKSAKPVTKKAKSTTTTTNSTSEVTSVESNDTNKSTTATGTAAATSTAVSTVEDCGYLTLNDITVLPATSTTFATPKDRLSLGSGNIDDTGSVASGILEEDICYECGVSTKTKDDWDNVVLCDICDAEYHLQCVNLDRLPRTTFVCSKCEKEAFHMSKLKFNVVDDFKIVKRSKEPRSVVYSPSKPLDLAWEECKKKGLMVVSEVFSHELMQQLTHGRIEKLTKSGRVAEAWQGACGEVDKRMQSTVCEGLVDREGRYDLRLPQFVVEHLKLDELLEPITSKLTTIMGLPKPQIRTHNIVFVPVGSKAQKWHVDDEVRGGKLHRYFTVLIHLNSLDSCCGGTEMWIEKTQSGDMVRSRPGDAFVFNGSLLHRGQANLGKTHRFFYYSSFACKADANTGEK